MWTLTAQSAALQRGMVQDWEEGAGLVAAQAALLARRGVTQGVLKMRHFGAGDDRVAARLDCRGAGRGCSAEQEHEDVAIAGPSGAR